MSRLDYLTQDRDALNQLAGITGLGWTASILGYLVTVIGYGSTLVSRIVVDPQSLLYLGGALFVATLGLDRLRNATTDDEETESDGAFSGLDRAD
ncbi:hypothetical protein [Salinarchaeum laminariae]|uniref:hypothetical protein n=1 Tax=Salinarchaeum laminariae TaxID=869888 RepID=UPI0020BECBA5|nr:hypothetical protein [Salinarchaeum laminariae]